MTSVHSKSGPAVGCHTSLAGATSGGMAPSEVNRAGVDHGPRLPVESVLRTRQMYGVGSAGSGWFQAYAGVLTVAVNTLLAVEKAASLFL